VRQSSPGQVRQHQESTQLQYRLVERAILLGWQARHAAVPRARSAGGTAAWRACRHPGGQNSSAQVGQNSLSQPDKFAQIGIVYLQPIHVIEEETDRLSGSMLIAVPEQPLDPLQVSQQFRTRCLIMMSDTTSVLAQHSRAHSDMEPVTAGIPLNMVQKWIDHAQLTTTAIYANAVGAEEKDIARKM